MEHLEAMRQRHMREMINLYWEYKGIGDDAGADLARATLARAIGRDKVVLYKGNGYAAVSTGGIGGLDNLKLVIFSEGVNLTDDEVK